MSNQTLVVLFFFFIKAARLFPPYFLGLLMFVDEYIFLFISLLISLLNVIWKKRNGDQTKRMKEKEIRRETYRKKERNKVGEKFFWFFFFGLELSGDVSRRVSQVSMTAQ